MTEVEKHNTETEIKLASERVRKLIDNAYDESQRIVELTSENPDLYPNPIIKNEEAELITHNGSLTTILKVGTERRVVSCETCDFLSTATFFNISHYSVEKGVKVTYDSPNGFVAEDGNLKIKKVKRIGIEELHKLREGHTPNLHTARSINSLFDQ